MHDTLNRRIANRVRSQRGDLSLREAEAESGVSYCTIKRVESGKPPSLANFVKLAKWCRLDVNKLFKAAR